MAPAPPPALVLTSDGHRSTYGLQAGGMYPTGKLSCLYLYLSSNKFFVRPDYRIFQSHAFCCDIGQNTHR